MFHRRFIIALCILTAGSMLSAQEILPGRKAILELTTQEKCLQTLKTSKDPVLRRHAFRRLIYTERTFDQAVKLGLKDPDEQIRKGTLYELYRKKGDQSVPFMRLLASDRSLVVAMTIAELSNGIRNRELRHQFQKELIAKTSFREVKKLAAKGFFDFYRNNIALSQNPSYDHDFVIARKIDLPENGWAFRTDVNENGHLRKYFAPAFNDSQWRRLSVTKSWEEQGFPGYNGIAWYRVKFKMPPKMACTTVEMAFGAVDEVAWVWLNGKYVGQHDLGPNGWKVPFRFDVSKEIQWGKENVLTVRVLDTMAAGGIWKKVHVEVLK